MWKALIDWTLALFGMVREIEAHDSEIRDLQRRVRDLEEAINLLIQEQRHAEEIAAAEREKLLLRFQAEIAKRPSLPPAKKRRKSK